MRARTAQKTFGVELACDLCPVVLRVNLTVGDGFPRHRCNDRPADFPIALMLDEPTKQPSRIDWEWMEND